MTAPTNFVWSVTAYKWQCEQCHDTGLEPTRVAAEAELADHTAEYHAPTSPDDSDEFDDLDEEILTFADLTDRYRAAWRKTADE